MPYTSAELLKAKEEGARIFNALDEEVEYKPRPDKKGDRNPWHVIGQPDDIAFRNRSGQCRPVARRGNGPWAVDRLITF